MDTGCEALVQHLNSQHVGLEGWRSSSTVMWVKMPNMVPVRLEGVIACSAPQYFRLTASNLIADADLGSNASRCWMYVRPGDPAVLTWRHEDTQLLHRLPIGVPYIDPNWLMMILGVKPLDAADYEIGPDPGGSRELWLTAIESSPHGRPLRRVIKVDTMRGVTREHAVYDSNSHPIMRAHISRHRNHDGHQIPTEVKLEFPQVDTEMTLTFRSIETNPHLPDDLWKLPSHNLEVRDIGQFAREYVQRQDSGAFSELPAREPQIRLQPPQFNSAVRSASAPDPFSENETSWPAIEEPEWDQPETPLRNASFSEPGAAAPPVPFWKRMLPFGRR